MTAFIRLSGTVESGKGEGAFFTQLEWFRDQCAKTLGFRPFPGTLNLRIRAEDRATIRTLDSGSGVAMIPPDGKWCSARAVYAEIGGLPAAVIFPERSVRVHGDDVLEIISPKNLKAALKIGDGDRVSVVIPQSLRGTRNRE